MRRQEHIIIWKVSGPKRHLPKCPTRLVQKPQERVLVIYSKCQSEFACAYGGKICCFDLFRHFVGIYASSDVFRKVLILEDKKRKVLY